MKALTFKSFIMHLLFFWLMINAGYSPVWAKSTQDQHNDTFGTNAVKIDILSIDVEFDSKYLYMTCNFSSPVFEADTGNPADLFGYIDLDVDQDSGTGTTALSDYYNGSSEIGMDYYLEFMPDAALGSVALKDCNAKTIGTVPVAFHGSSFVVTIPLTMIGNDDGYINYTAFFGDAGGPDDVIPNRGFATNKVTSSPGTGGSAAESNGTAETAGNKSGGGCFINTVTGSSNNPGSTNVIILMSGLFLAVCLVIIKKTLP